MRHQADALAAFFGQAVPLFLPFEFFEKTIADGISGIAIQQRGCAVQRVGVAGHQGPKMQP